MNKIFHMNKCSDLSIITISAMARSFCSGLMLKLRLYRMRYSSKLVVLFKAFVVVFLAVSIFLPIYIALADFSDNVEKEDDGQLLNEGCFDPPIIQPAGDGSKAKEEERLIRVLTEEQTTCDRLELPGKVNHALTSEREDLRWNSYICIGGISGLKKHDCLVYAFGIKHEWTKFAEAVEKHLGCRVYAFDPALDMIDHYYTRNVRFFNARLSDIDQQAQYKVPGPPGWKYRTFLTLMKELHFDDAAVDHIRLDVTLDIRKGMNSMLQDGSLFTFVKQLSFEYDLNQKDAAEMREIYNITKWLNKQGFLLAHSQPTKLSGKSYAVLYVNTKIG